METTTTDDSTTTTTNDSTTTLPDDENTNDSVSDPEIELPGFGFVFTGLVILNIGFFTRYRSRRDP